MSADRVIASLFLLAAAAGIGLTIVYALGGQPQLEGILLGVALGGIGIGLILWGTHLLPHDRMEEHLEERSSAEPVRADVKDELERGEAQVARRSFLVRALVAAAGALGVAAVFPIRSLGPNPGRALEQTAWTPGARLVTRDGRPVRLGDLQDGSVVTVFPEGETDSADAQVLLIKVDPASLRMPGEQKGWAPGGNVAYSKVCTHAGCPVGLFRAETNELLCPCHQSTFDVLDGARPIFGPAARPLAQLPVTVDDDGFLVARSDFTEPIGPAYWDRS